MAVKFISFKQDPFKPFDFKDQKKWKPSKDGRVYKLINPDLEKDKQTVVAYIKSVKALVENEKLYIQGIANANIVDRMQERLDPRGIDLENYMKNSQLLAHHSYYHPIGQVESIEIQEDGIYFRAWLGDPAKAPLTDMQKEMRSLVAQGILKTVSVGFIPNKIRAPLYNDAGDLEEPCVIESWELLELSVVAVPCNQDSVFEVRTSKDNKDTAIIKPSSNKIESLYDNKLIREFAQKVSEQQNVVVQTLIFDKTVFTESEAIKWAKDHDFVADKVDETETSYRLRQHDPEEFDQETFKTITLTEGVQAVSGKKKDGEGGKEGGEEGQDYSMMMQQMHELMKRIAEQLDLVLKKLEEKPGASDDGGEAPPPPPKEDEGKALKDRLKKLESGFEKLVSSVSLLVNKLNK